MNERINPFGRPDLVQPLIDYSMKVEDLGLEPGLVNLVKIRASQLNGCAMCLNFHVGEAHKRGEAEIRIHLLPGWRESPLYSPREKAALAWTDALTRMDRHDEAEAFALVAGEFDAAEQIALNLLIGAINSFNRIGVGFAVGHPLPSQQAA
jgi:AhpD family alkylhydroperoxidase